MPNPKVERLLEAVLQRNLGERERLLAVIAEAEFRPDTQAGRETIVALCATEGRIIESLCALGRTPAAGRLARAVGEVNRRLARLGAEVLTAGRTAAPNTP